MSQNLVIPNKDNKVVFVFAGVVLTSATNIIVNFGSETYTLLLDPTIVVVSSATELSLDLSATAEVGKIYATVTYIDGDSTNGTDITSRALGNSDKIVVAVGTQLTIENGTGVAGANSFVTDVEFKAYADLIDKDIPATQPSREAILANAYNYMNMTYESQLQGRRTVQGQTGIFPRYDVIAYGYYVDSSTIPEDVKKAQMVIALAINNGADTNAVKTSADLASFTVVGVYSETYQSGSSAPELPIIPAASRLLSAYTNRAAGGGLYRQNMGFLG